MNAPARRGTLSQRFVGILSVLIVLALGGVLVALLVAEPGPSKRPRVSNFTYYPEPVAKPGYHLDHQSIGERGVAAYLLSKDEPGAVRPAVILIHGGAITDALEYERPQYKGEWLISHFEETPYSLAEAGMLVVIIDAWWAGERHRPEHEALALAHPVSAVFHGYVETSRDVSSVLDYLCARGDVDPERLGVAGKSGGGITSLMSACRDDRLKAVVAWKGWADFALITQLRGQSMIVSQAMNDGGGFKEELEAMDPIYHLDGIPPKAVALIGNREDPLMPRQAAEQLYEKLRPLYAEYPERLKLQLFDTPKPTHDLTPEALVAGCNWLKKYL